MDADATKKLEEENARLKAENARLQSALDHAMQRLLLLTQTQYDRSRERFEGQGELPFGTPEEEPVPPPHVDEAPDEESEVVQKKKRKRGVRRLREDLPRERVVIEPTEEEKLCPCCGEERIVIGEEITELLDYQPASFKIREIVRLKLACKQHEEEGVFIPDLPPSPIEKGMVASGLLAQVMPAKYRDHLPLYRQAGIYRRHGVEMVGSTMGDWVRDVAQELKPIVDHIRVKALASGYVSTDDTSVTVLDPKHPKGSRKGFLWVYLGEHPGDCYYDFTQGRTRDAPKRVLDGFKGYVQADAYAGYDQLYRSGEILEVGCMAHARRKFFEAKENDPERSEITLRVMRELYAIERHAKQEDLSHEDRMMLRKEEAAPLLHGLEAWLESEQDRVLPQSAISKAMRYHLGNRVALRRYLKDGRLAIDNNRSERAMRQIAVDRKNWMVAGSDAGGQRAAILYSLTVGCWELGIDPFTYPRDVLERVAVTPCTEIASLAPRGWAEDQRT